MLKAKIWHKNVLSWRFGKYSFETLTRVWLDQNSLFLWKKPRKKCRNDSTPRRLTLPQVIFCLHRFGINCHSYFENHGLSSINNLTSIWINCFILPKIFRGKRLGKLIITVQKCDDLMYNSVSSIMEFLLWIATQGDLTQIFPTFSNPILNLNFYINVDPKSTYMSNIQQNSVELCTNLRFCHQAPI